MKYFLLAAPVVTLVAACSGGNVKMQPGEWEMKMELVDVKAEGLPPGALDMMKQQMAGQTQKRCLSQADVDNMSAEKLSGDTSTGCTASNTQFGGGTVRADLNCTGQGGGPTGTVNMNGSYTADSLTISTKSDITMPGMPGKMNMEMNITGRRLGDCPAGTK